MPHRNTDDVRRWRSASPYALAGLLGVAGVLHFLVPRSFASIVPPQLPAPYPLVYVSGVAELVCATGLLVPRTRRVSGWAACALFLVVFPANVQMALDSGGRSTGYQVGVWARLPLQVPLIWWAASVARLSRRTPTQVRR